MFIWRNKHGFVITVIYVDDTLLCGPNKALVQELKEKFMKKWECQDLGDVTEFLRMKVYRNGSKINLDQCAYLETVLECCGMQNCKSAATPLLAGYMPEPVSPVTGYPLSLPSETLPSLPSPPARSFCDLQVLTTFQRILPPFAETSSTLPFHSATLFALPNLRPRDLRTSTSCLSGILLKFRPFLPISPNFMLY